MVPPFGKGEQGRKPQASFALAQNRERLAQALLAEEVLDEARIEAVVGHPRR